MATLVLSVFPLPPPAEAQGPLTLQGAVERALRNNPALWTRRQELGMTVGELVTEGTFYLKSELSKEEIGEGD